MKQKKHQTVRNFTLPLVTSAIRQIYQSEQFFNQEIMRHKSEKKIQVKTRTLLKPWRASITKVEYREKGKSVSCTTFPNKPPIPVQWSENEISLGEIIKANDSVFYC